MTHSSCHLSVLPSNKSMIGSSFLFPLLSAPLARARSSASSDLVRAFSFPFTLPPSLRFRFSPATDVAAVGLRADLSAFQLDDGAAGTAGWGVAFLTI